MESNVFTAVLLPIALGIVMLGLGLTLTLADFARVLKYPRAVVAGLLCQVLVLPFAAVLLAHAFALPPELAVGLMLLAASPGGATANLYSHLANGDVALNITMTAVNSVLAVVTFPLVVNLSIAHFLGTSGSLGLELGKVVQIFVIVLGPVSLGMLVRGRKPELAERMNRPVRVLSALVLVLVIVGAILRERAMIGEYFRQVGLVALVFNLLSLATGYLVPRLIRLGREQAVAIGMEIGIHNGAMAIAVASSPLMLNNSTMAIPPAVYSLIMFFTAAAFGWWANRSATKTATAVQPG
ncbi:MAG: bile acid:sodium symporter family protein [Myxococcaceae bacterium]|nr:bile acid:sodium symporter family protein [Myxococcaceae bacterium]MCI0671602.1 bile acid:sodium symporter family protein [Myxococcaceae bacterium]